MYLDDDGRCDEVNHNSNLFGVKLLLMTVVLVTLNLYLHTLLVICAVHEGSRGLQSTHSTVTW